MTRYEWMKKNRPENLSMYTSGGVSGCPGSYEDTPFSDDAPTVKKGCDRNCAACWHAEIEEHQESVAASVDNVNHPAHYELPGGIECFDVLMATQGLEAVKNFCICNAMKYLFRRNRKNGDEDVKKAAWYIAKYIELSKEVSANG